MNSVETNLYGFESYALEAQGMLVAQLQRDEEMIVKKSIFAGAAGFEKEGLNWHRIMYGVRGLTFTCYSQNCDEEELGKLLYGNLLEIVQSNDTMDGINDTPRVAVGLVSFNGAVIYRSPGFDMKLYEEMPIPEKTNIVTIPHVEMSNAGW